MKILVGVSGGIDSMCLVHKYLGGELPCDNFAVAHCNFHLRAEESDGDELFVRQWCRDHGVECYAKDFDTRLYSSEKGISIEMAARELRYYWFQQVCIDKGFDALAVAHNANDNAETLILNLLRGTGGRGLRGMQECITWKEGILLLRPLIHTSREEIENYVNARGIRYRNDSTNSDTIYRRNQIRHEVFPVFNQINPSFIDTFSREMGLFTQENDIAEDYFLSRRNILCKEGKILINKLLKDMHWKYLLFRITEELELPYGVLESLYKMLENGLCSGKEFKGRKGSIITSSDSLLLCLDEINEEEELLVYSEGDYKYKGKCLKISIIPRHQIACLKQAKGSLIFDFDSIVFPIKLRSWKEGDWFYPFGMKGKKKISDLFTDGKWSLIDKRNAIVAIPADFSDGHIGAVLGYRSDDTLKVDDGCSRILKIEII